MAESTSLIPKVAEYANVVGYGIFDSNEQHRIKISELLLSLGTTLEGLSQEDIKIRREHCGFNCIPSPLTLPSFLCCLLPIVESLHSMKRYRECLAEVAVVKRSGQWLRVDSSSLVPGDIIRITEGCRVPADIRLFKSDRCVFDASSLMGQGVKVRADLFNVTPKFLDSPNIAFAGYLCAEGDCCGVVLLTGEHTFLANLIALQHWPVD